MTSYVGALSSHTSLKVEEEGRLAEGGTIPRTKRNLGSRGARSREASITTRSKTDKTTITGNTMAGHTVGTTNLAEAVVEAIGPTSRIRAHQTKKAEAKAKNGRGKGKPETGKTSPTSPKAAPTEKEREETDSCACVVWSGGPAFGREGGPGARLHFG